MQGRKHPKMIVDGYCYILHSRKLRKTRWRCVNTNKKCSATLFSFGKTVEVLYEHNHDRPALAYDKLYEQKVTIIR